MALDDRQILVQSFTAAKEFIKRGILSADDKAIFASYPAEIYHHKDLPVSRKADKQFLDCIVVTGRKRRKQRRGIQPSLLLN